MNTLGDNQASTRQNSPELRKLISRVKSRDAVRRASAIIELGRMGEEATPAVHVLIVTLKDHTRLTVEDHTPLTSIRVSPIQYRFTSLSELAEGALVRIGPAAVDPLIDALKNHSNIEVRIGAARTLGRIGDERAKKSLIQMIKDKEPRIRAASIRELSNLQSANIFDLSEEENERLRQEIAELVIAALEKSIEERSYVVQEASAKALRRMNNNRIVELLIAVAEQDAPVEARQAVTYTRSGRKKRQRRTEDRSSWRRARKAAIEALGDINDSRVVRSLVRIMKDEKDSMQETAIRALGYIENADATKALFEALDDKSYSTETHNIIVGTLGWIRDPRVVEALLIKYENDRFNGTAKKTETYKLAGNSFKSLEEAKKWWERAQKRLEEKQEWWWEDPPDANEVAKYAKMEEAMQNGQVYVGMLIPDLVKLWGDPMVLIDSGRGKSFMVYMYKKVGEIRSLQVTYENYQIVNIEDNLGNEMGLKGKSESD